MPLKSVRCHSLGTVFRARGLQERGPGVPGAAGKFLQPTGTPFFLQPENAVLHLFVEKHLRAIQFCSSGTKKGRRRALQTRLQEQPSARHEREEGWLGRSGRHATQRAQGLGYE